MNARDPRNLGQLGEKTLEKWAAARGICAQKPSEDRTGWDVLLEFPQPTSCDPTPLPLDRTPAPISCLVQVKSTSKGRLTPKVKLTSWMRLIAHPLPTFFLLLDFGPDESPRAAYLVPVDFSAMGRALRRVRELDSQSKAVTGQTLAVSVTQAHKLESPTSESLEKAIRAAVGPNLDAFVEQKAKWRRQIGYEETSAMCTFRFSLDALGGKSVDECLVDLALGLREPLPISSAEIRDVRFGIAAKRPSHVLPVGTLEITRKPTDRVEVELSLGISVVRFTMDMYLPQGLGRPIAEDAFKVRFMSALFDFAVDRSKSTSISFHLPEEWARIGLRALYDLACIVLLIEESARHGKDIGLSIYSSEGRLLMRSEMEVHERMRPEVFALAELVRAAWMIGKQLELPESVESSIADLFRQEGRLKVFCALLGNAANEFRLGFFDSSLLVHEGERVCVPVGTEVLLGSYRGTVVSSFWGELKRTGQSNDGQIEFAVAIAERRLEAVFATKFGEESKMGLNEAVREVAEAQGDTVTCLILPQYAESRLAA